MYPYLGKVTILDRFSRFGNLKVLHSKNREIELARAKDAFSLSSFVIFRKVEMPDLGLLLALHLINLYYLSSFLLFWTFPFLDISDFQEAPPLLPFSNFDR
jgi:hypothetical protein